MMKSRKIAVLFLLAMLFFSAAPLFVFAADEDSVEQDGDETETNLNNFTMEIQARKMLEIANRAAARIEQLIENANRDETLIKILENANLTEDLEKNITLFEDAKKLLETASEAINSNDYEDAVANITEAMETFREVYRAIHKIINKYTVASRKGVIAWGLIVAMNRSLERIEQIRNISDNDEDILELLDEAEQFLDIEAAKEMLADGNVTGVAHNLAEANRLIGEAHKLLKDRAKMKVQNRMHAYLNIMEKSCQKILSRINHAKKMGVNVSDVLEKLGYQNETEFKEELLNMIRTARGKVSDIKESLLELQRISQAFWRMNRVLTKHVFQDSWKSHEPWSDRGQSQSREHNQTQNKPVSGGRGSGKRGIHGNKPGRP